MLNPPREGHRPDYASVPWGSPLVAPLRSTGSPGFSVFAPAGEQRALIAQFGIEQADADAARIVRLEHGKPRYCEDVTARFLAQETNQSRTRAQLHRSLMPLPIDDDAEITSAPFSPALAKVALAYVRTA